MITTVSSRLSASNTQGRISSLHNVPTRPGKCFGNHSLNTDSWPSSARKSQTWLEYYERFFYAHFPWATLGCQGSATSFTSPYLWFDHVPNTGECCVRNHWRVRGKKETKHGDRHTDCLFHSVSPRHRLSIKTHVFYFTEADDKFRMSCCVDVPLTTESLFIWLNDRTHRFTIVRQ